MVFVLVDDPSQRRSRRSNALSGAEGSRGWGRMQIGTYTATDGQTRAIEYEDGAFAVEGTSLSREQVVEWGAGRGGPYLLD